jgi:hypothetical protein
MPTRGKYHPKPKAGYQSLLKRVFGDGKFAKSKRKNK